MIKDSSRQTFEQKQKYVVKKRVLAYQKIIKNQNFIKLKEETEFLEGIHSKSYMYEEAQKEFNQKFSKQYNKIQTLYKKSIQNKNNDNKKNQQRKEKITFNINKDFEE
ncbi:unnamed protein product [Paramecium sonneborni]|uniref:Uncharacterized protein n=1 Tax=Paramecium sonneborni TaxID=65129 RepID=A0A8S1QP86_9CILI|nr:unnamed protein product [Paramecium sonneborni]